MYENAGVALATAPATGSGESRRRPAWSYYPALKGLAQELNACLGWTLLRNKRKQGNL